MKSKSGVSELRPYWVSWWQTKTMSPFTWWGPWWFTGFRGDDASSVCAAVMATDDEDARSRIAGCFDRKPDEIEWRICEELTDGASPFSDRFQRRDWMVWPTGDGKHGEVSP